MNESAPGSPQSAVNQSADNSADNQSADDGESAVVKTGIFPLCFYNIYPSIF